MRAALLCLLFLPLVCGDRSTYEHHKLVHVAAGIAVYEVCKLNGAPKTGVALAFGLGIAKETYDKRHGGKFRGGDVAWTSGPAAFCFAVRW